MDSNKLNHLGPTRSVGVGTVMVAAFVALFLSVAVAARPAPPFSLKDAQGSEIKLADYAGKPLILHFWASWCPYCKKLQPGLQRLSDDYSERGLVVLGINFREDEGVMPQMVLKSRGLSFTTGVQGDKVARDYGVKGTPTTFFINRAGEILGVSNTSDPADPALEHLTGLITE